MSSKHQTRSLLSTLKTTHSAHRSAMRIIFSLRIILIPLVLIVSVATYLHYQITLRGAQVTDGGKYTCRAKNEAGSADIDLTLKVLVPPSIDKSNIIGNPLAIVGRSIYLECPVTGIPQPTVTWYKEGNLIDARDERIVLDQNNQTFGILYVEIADQGRYFCVAENRGGKAEQEFNLEVLVPPQMETTELQRFTRREDDSLTLWCPVKQSTDSTTITEIFWYKDGRPIDSNSAHNLRVTSDGRRLQVMRTTLGDAGNYTCIALNRAGESSLDFDVEILCRNLATEKCRQLEMRHIVAYREAYERRKYEMWRHNQKIQNMLNRQKINVANNRYHHRAKPSELAALSSPVISTTILNESLSSSSAVGVHADGFAVETKGSKGSLLTSQTNAHHRFEHGIRGETEVLNRQSLDFTITHPSRTKERQSPMGGNELDMKPLAETISVTAHDHRHEASDAEERSRTYQKSRLENEANGETRLSQSQATNYLQSEADDIHVVPSNIDLLDFQRSQESESHIRQRAELLARQQAEAAHRRQQEAWRDAERQRQQLINHANEEYRQRLAAWRKANEERRRVESSYPQRVGTHFKHPDEERQLESSRRHSTSTNRLASNVDANAVGGIQVGIESNPEITSHLHKLRRPHHQHHRHRLNGKHHSHKVSENEDSLRESQRTAMGADDKKQSNRWGGKLLLYQTEWQPWDPDYSDGEWSSWYSYSNAIQERHRR